MVQPVPTEIAAQAPHTSAEPSAADRPILALLKAAKPRGLVLWQNNARIIMATSNLPNYGWYAAASWDHAKPSSDAGGPWSREFVEYVASLGLIGISPHSDRTENAALTKAGRAYLKDALSKASPQKTGNEGEVK